MVRFLPGSIEYAVGFHHVIHNVTFGDLQRERKFDRKCKLLSNDLVGKSLKAA